VVNFCTDVAGDNPVACASFRYYYQTTAGAGHDILDGYQQCLPNSPNLPPNYTATSAGITTFPINASNLLFVIEMDSVELEAAVAAVGTQTEHPYVQVVIGNGAYATYACVIAVLSGLRIASNVGQTVTT
jgi:hypothetical protein